MKSPASVAWRPNEGPQTRFLSSTAFELLYGGAAGGGKSEGLLAGALRYINRAEYRAILFRRTSPDLVRSLIDRSQKLYPVCGGEFRQDKSLWQFPSGARVYLSHMQYESDVHSHQSAEYQYVGFDELTTFTQRQYTYLISRLRSSSGLPSRIRSATNPGGEGAPWVLRRWAPWLVPVDRWETEGIEGWLTPAAALDGEVLSILQVDDDHEGIVERGTPDSLTRVFVPAKLSDNPHLALGDPQYRARLMSMDAVTRLQLLGGLWLVKVSAGLMFRKDWFGVVPRLPEGEAFAFLRYWDRAATEPSKVNPDPDWTVGCLVARALSSGRFYILGVERFRGRPAEVIARVKRTAQSDRERWGHVVVGLEQEPGASGVFEIASYVSELAGFPLRVFKPGGSDGSKVVRAKPASSQAEQRAVSVVAPGSWWGPVAAELEAFPEGGHDDAVDAFAGAVTALSSCSGADYVRISERFEGVVVSSRAGGVNGIYASDDD